jgi:hypothetical protein
MQKKNTQEDNTRYSRGLGKPVYDSKGNRVGQRFGIYNRDGARLAYVVSKDAK